MSSIVNIDGYLILTEDDDDGGPASNSTLTEIKTIIETGITNPSDILASPPTATDDQSTTIALGYDSTDNTVQMLQVQGGRLLCEVGAISLTLDNTTNHTDLLALEASLTSIEGKMDTDNAVLDVHTGHLSEIEAAVETLEACVDSNKVNVNISSFGANSLATEGKQDSFIAANHTDLVHLSDNLDTTNGHLNTIKGDTTSLDGKVTACNTGAVVISSGSVTASLSATDNAVIDVIAANTQGLENVNAKITACNTGAVVLAAGSASIGSVALSATDNAVIDVIAANTQGLENVNGKITACNTGAVVITSGEVEVSNFPSIVTGDDETLTAAEQRAIYGRDPSGVLRIIETDNAGKLKILDSVATGSVDSVFAITSNFTRSAGFASDGTDCRVTKCNTEGKLEVINLPEDDTTSGTPWDARTAPTGVVDYDAFDPYQNTYGFLATSITSASYRRFTLIGSIKIAETFLLDTTNVLRVQIWPHENTFFGDLVGPIAEGIFVGRYLYMDPIEIFYPLLQLRILNEGAVDVVLTLRYFMRK